MTVPPPRSRAASERPFSLAAGATWTIGLWLLEHVCFELTESARPGAITDIVSIAACIVLATSIVVFAIVRLHAPERALRATLGFTALGPGALVRLPLCALAGAALCPALSTLDDLISKRWPYDDPDALESMDKLVSSSPRVALVVCVFVVIPLAREFFFRGLVFGAMRRSAAALPVVAGTALLYAAFSFDLRAAPSALLLGLALGCMRESAGTTMAALVAGLAFSAVNGLPILRGVDPQADIAYPTSWTIAGAALAILAIAGMAARPATRESLGRFE